MVQEIISIDDIHSKIHTIRGVQVMLDSDLAQMYHVETRVLNQAVKRNQNRFPESFCFQLSSNEYELLKSQIVISSDSSSWGGVRKMPFVFTEHGVTMLSSVLRSDIAVAVGVRIVQEFVSMRRFLATPWSSSTLTALNSSSLRQMRSSQRYSNSWKPLNRAKQ